MNDKRNIVLLSINAINAINGTVIDKDLGY